MGTRQLKPVRLANSCQRRSSKVSKNTLSLPHREDLSTNASNASSMNQDRFRTGSPFYSSCSNRHYMRLPAAFSPAKSPCSAKLKSISRFSSRRVNEINMSGDINSLFEQNKVMTSEESFNLTKVAPNQITLCDESDNEEVLETINLESRYGSKQNKHCSKVKP